MESRRGAQGGLAGLTLIAALLIGGFASLGVWQVHRLSWKRDLIARVDARIHAAPVPAPRSANASDEYRRVAASGRFRHDEATLVQASTALGAGYWVMTPLVTDAGFTLLVNRGFVSPEARRSYARPMGQVHITGLVRLSEPVGGFLRANDPAANRWYSRDVAAIATARHLPEPVAPYFIDANAMQDALPIGGLTIVTFPNSHLVYAVTWFALAAMTLAAYIYAMFSARTPPNP
ncbi:SURF1 family protein [Sphingobium sp. AN558]|uniref:SURF1 family protein n=1 Tax=Sphingobium sp. AN558 TaxID=3133442 RepID=UPI0030C420AA